MNDLAKNTRQKLSNEPNDIFSNWIDDDSPINEVIDEPRIIINDNSLPRDNDHKLNIEIETDVVDNEGPEDENDITNNTRIIDHKIWYCMIWYIELFDN